MNVAVGVTKEVIAHGKKYTRIEYKCSYCGATQMRSATSGRPDPGNCMRKPKDSSGRYKPHSWVINRKI